MATCYTKLHSPWLQTFDVARALRDPSYLNSHTYYTRLFRAWPDWAVYPELYKYMYKDAQRRTAEGNPHEVDHIVPIRSPLVCGLHVPWNLRVIPKQDNAVKSNHWWPDMPDSPQLPLDISFIHIHQLTLL